MQNRLVQTSSRTEISADLISNRTEIGADLISNCTKIGIDATNCTRLTKISAVLDCTKIGADYIYTIAESSGIMRMPHARANCTGRVLIRKVFNDKVVQLAIAIKAIYIKPNQLTSLRAPIALFKAIDLNWVFKHDFANQLLSFLDKLKAIKKINTFKIIRGRILVTFSLITARQVLRQRFKANGLLRRRKVRLVAKRNKQQAKIDYFKTFASVI